MSPLQIYYWDDHNNFGDLINPWLWSKLMPEIDMEPLPKKEDGIVDAGDKTKIYCVRDPLSVKALDLPESYAAIDAGVLVNRFLPEAPSVKYKFSYMPQISSGVKCRGV